MSEEKVKLSELIPLDEQSKMQKSLELLNSIESVEIKTKDQYQNAAELVKSIKGSEKALENDRKELTQPYWDKKKAIDSKYKEVIDKLKNGSKQISNAMSKWYEEEKRKNALEQKKREAEAEAKRIKLEEAAAKEAEKVSKYQEEGKEELAEKAQARMEDKIEEAQTIVAQEVESTKITGVSYRTTYELKIKDHEAVARYLLGNDLTSHLVMVNEAELKKLMVASKGKMKIPEVDLIETKTPIVRS